MASKELRHAVLFDEFAGLLKELLEQDGILIAIIGENHLALPLEIKQDLQPLIGQRITILHTDIPNRPYIFRILSLEDNQSK